MLAGTSPSSCGGGGVGSFATTTAGLHDPASDTALLATVRAQRRGRRPALASALRRALRRGRPRAHAPSGRRRRRRRLPIAWICGQRWNSPRLALSLKWKRRAITKPRVWSRLRPAALDFREVFDGHVSYVAATLGRLGVDDRDRGRPRERGLRPRSSRASLSYDAARPMKPWLFAFAARVASEHRRLARHRREVFAEVDMASSDLGARRDDRTTSGAPAPRARARRARRAQT